MVFGTNPSMMNNINIHDKASCLLDKNINASEKTKKIKQMIWYAV